MYGPLSGVVLLGALFPCANGAGALAGALGGKSLHVVWDGSYTHALSLSEFL